MMFSGASRKFGNMRIVTALCAVTIVAACIPAKDKSPPQTAQTPPRLETDISVLEQDIAPPVWERRSVQANARRVEGGIYTVKSGDTLRGIGNRMGAGSEIIARVNNLAPPYTIYPGQKLTVPSGRYHSVASGETGIAIARAYGAPWSRIVRLNGLEEPYILRIGQRLLLPGKNPSNDKVPSTAPDRQERAAAFDIGIGDIVSGGQPALAEGRAAARPTRATAQAASTKAIALPTKFAGRFQWPLRGRLASSFGKKGGGRVNEGIDIIAPRGTPILAAADGVVSYSGDEIAVFGGLVLISHGDGWVTAYGHADRLDVVRGQAVKAGQVIGISGDSGYASQPQLHFEIRKQLKPVDPIAHLPGK
ncbi:peptidoglycan DD-metalloendopeptidase family protein [Sphingorhabdus sp. Alg239-R122]|uniref:peptidoglycan DD-metalloendopeptidase family protein n=1 Tax=Sphingorhabdus sp. Alg239-R122 TaxID=2305989 RepID=UPI001F0712C8|nr:peptidoglycan DD-metalloendopeptidase family protein [Sphingorhabdus sp. Alg239-R122]